MVLLKSKIVGFIHFHFSFILSHFLDLELRVSMMLYICHRSHNTVTSYNHIITYHKRTWKVLK